MLKILFLTHRYLGIGLGLIMLLWCLSGFVMMYKPYPELNREEQLATRPQLDMSACCTLSVRITGAGESEGEIAGGREGEKFSGFSVQMLDRIPVLVLDRLSGEKEVINLHSGQQVESWSLQAIENSGLDFGKRQGFDRSNLLGEIYNDQWTVYGAYNQHRPLFRFTADDAADTQWYVSSLTGEIVQVTTREQRIWGYLGAVIHWLYPTLLRENVLLWSQTVIWLTFIGIFLTVTGLYFGIRQYKVRKNGRKSPYRGLSLWHHYAGLFFGVLTLSWVFSGLFSMNPWGWLEGESDQREIALLRGGEFSWPQVRVLVEQIKELPLQNDTVLIEASMLMGNPGFNMVARDGNLQRFDARTLQASHLKSEDRERMAALLAGNGKIASVQMIDSEDTYYYHHHEKVRLPAIRIITDTPDQTRYYLDPQSGELLQKIDGEKQWYRWVFYGFHRGDFTSLLRSRPVWDIFMWALLLGVTAVCVSGFFMGLRRLKRNI